MYNYTYESGDTYESIEKTRKIYLFYIFILFIPLLALTFVYFKYHWSTKLIENTMGFIMILLWIGLILFLPLFFSAKIKKRRHALLSEAREIQGIQRKEYQTLSEYKRRVYLSVFKDIKEFNNKTGFFSISGSLTMDLKGLRVLQRDGYYIETGEITIGEEKNRRNTVIMRNRIYNIVFDNSLLKDFQEKIKLFHNLKGVYWAAKKSIGDYLLFIPIFLLGWLFLVLPAFIIYEYYAHGNDVSQTGLPGNMMLYSILIAIAIAIIAYYIVRRKSQRLRKKYKKQSSKVDFSEIPSSLHNPIKDFHNRFPTSKMTLGKNYICIGIPSLGGSEGIFVSNESWQEYYDTDEIIRKFADDIFF